MSESLEDRWSAGWLYSQEERGYFELRDNGDTISITIGPSMGGATIEERIEWLMTAFENARHVLKRTPINEIVANIIAPGSSTDHELWAALGEPK